MARRFIFLSVALATIFISIIARAGSLALDSAGNLFVGEGHSVIKYAPDGAESIFAEGLNCSLGLTFDPNGNLFVADGAVTATRTNRAILKFATDGTRSTFATGISSAGLACDSAGDLFVSNGDSIFKFTLNGVKSAVVTSKLANFIDLAFDRTKGNFFVVDQAMTDARVGRSIVKFSADMRSFSIFVAIAVCAISGSFSVLAADREGVAAQDEFAAFWNEFKGVVASSDKVAVAQLTKFPILDLRLAH